MSAGEPGAAYCRGSPPVAGSEPPAGGFELAEEEGLAPADPALPTAVGLPPVAGSDPPAGGFE